MVLDLLICDPPRRACLGFTGFVPLTTGFEIAHLGELIVVLSWNTLAPDWSDG